MSDHGFIDSSGSDRARLARLEVLLDEALHLIGIDALSPAAQAIYADLTSEDAGRVARARATLAEQATS